ncbi:hypothetical protein U91I_01942 [alpha proteobacterium U9-1i]|nr:hypothetical protein U91I_01942 [alpha proteobacterium U9-1i]
MTLTKILATFTLACAANACGPDPSAANRDIARGVIERSEIGGAFVDASTPEAARLRHRESGLVCAIPASGAFQVETFPPSAANEGASCMRATGQVVTTLMAMKFGHDVALDQAFGESVITSARLEGATPWTGAESAADAAHGDADRIVRLRGRAGPDEVYFRVAMTQAGDWFIQQIVFAPIESAEAAEQSAGEDWRIVMSQVQR